MTFWSICLRYIFVWVAAADWMQNSRISLVCFPELKRLRRYFWQMNIIFNMHNWLISNVFWKCGVISYFFKFAFLFTQNDLPYLYSYSICSVHKLNVPNIEFWRHLSMQGFCIWMGQAAGKDDHPPKNSNSIRFFSVHFPQNTDSDQS